MPGQWQPRSKLMELIDEDEIERLLLREVVFHAPYQSTILDRAFAVSYFLLGCQRTGVVTPYDSRNWDVLDYAAHLEGPLDDEEAASVAELRVSIASVRTDPAVHGRRLEELLLDTPVLHVSFPDGSGGLMEFSLNKEGDHLGAYPIESAEPGVVNPSAP